MGNRSSIVVESQNFPNPIYLYGHWSGEDHFEAVKAVIERTDRIGDASYLTAQLFYTFAVELGSYTGGTGFGIGTYAGDIAQNCLWEDNDPVVVNADSGAVTYRGEVYEPISLPSLSN